jgi:hypothetical protein
MVQTRHSSSLLHVVIAYYPTFYRGRTLKKTKCMGPYSGVDYNLTLCPLQSRLQHIYHGQSYARVDLNPMPE